MKKRVPFLLSLLFLLFISKAFVEIKTNGIKKNTLLDEFYPDNPKLKEYLNYSEHFDQELNLQAIFTNKSHNPLTTLELLSIQDFLDKNISPITGISPTLTLKNMGSLYIEDKKVLIAPLLKENNKIDLKVLEKLTSLKFYQKYVFSPKKKALILNFSFTTTNRLQKELALKKVINAIQIQNKESSYTINLLGAEYLRYSIFDEIKRSYLKLFPLMAIIIGLIVFMAYRSYSLIAILFATLGFSFGATGAITYLLNGSISAFSSFSLFFVFIIGTSDVIHLFSKLHERSSDRDLNINNAVEEIFKPCFLTSLTTLIGLLALTLSPFKTLHQFGLNGSIGIIISFLTCFYILPPVLNYLYEKRKISFSSFSQKKLFLFSPLKRPKLYLIVGSLFLVFNIFGMANLKFEDNFFKKFTPDHPLSQALKVSQEEFKNLSYIELLIPSDTLREDFFSQVISQINSLEKVQGSLSKKDLEQDIERMTKTPSLNKVILNQMDLVDISSFFNSKKDQRFSRVFIYLKDFKIQTLIEVKEKTAKILKERNLNEIVSISGFSLFRTYFHQLLKGSFEKSFFVSFVLIFFVFLVNFKSLKIALIAMIPNIAPPLAVISTMGILNISADMNLALICSLALAISVDDTIHFLHSYTKNRRSKNNVQAIRSTIKEVSFPLIVSTLIFCCAILVFKLGRIQLFSQFSQLTSLSLITALVYDLIVLPSLLYLLPVKIRIDSRGQK